MMKNPYGMTNDLTELEAVVDWKLAAIADGWQPEPTYQHEPIESACTLMKDGWKAMIFLRRPSKAKYKYEASVTVWGPDGLCVEVPDVYSWDQLQKNARKYSACGKEDVETVRYSFAGRCCKECLPEMRRKHEQPGWCD